jgi:hypothetical protein
LLFAAHFKQSSAIKEGNLGKLAADKEERTVRYEFAVVIFCYSAVNELLFHLCDT